MAMIPGLDQWAFRFGNDDGSEAAYTFMAAQDTDVVFTSANLDTNFFIRIGLQENGLGTNIDAQLEYSLNGGAWTNVNAASSVVRSSASANIADNASTTERLTGLAFNFIAGEYDEVDGLCQTVTFNGGDESEFVHCVQVRSADVANGNTIDLKITNAGTDISNYLDIPRITINLSNPTQDQSGFRFRNDDGGEGGDGEATWKAAANTDVIFGSSDLDANFRLRIMTTYVDTGASEGQNIVPQLQYSQNGGAYTNVNGSSSVARSSASALVADGEATTEQMAGPNAFVAGSFDEVDGICASTAMTDPSDSEHEYCLQIRSADTANLDTIDFRLVNTATPYTSYTEVGRITLALLSNAQRSGFLEFFSEVP